MELPLVYAMALQQQLVAHKQQLAAAAAAMDLPGGGGGGGGDEEEEDGLSGGGRWGLWVVMLEPGPCTVINHSACSCTDVPPAVWSLPAVLCVAAQLHTAYR